MKPTLKNCMNAFPKPKGLIVFGLIQEMFRNDDPEFRALFPNTSKWINSCHNEPSKPEVIMSAIDETLENHGVEAIRGRHVDNYHYDIQACYSNTGDSYALTILHDNERGEYLITSWGDWVEKNEKRRQLQ